MLEYVISSAVLVAASALILHMRSHRDYFSEEHFLKGYPSGTFYVREKYRGILLLLVFAQIVPFWWVYTNYPPMAMVASVYLFFLIPLVGVFYLEMMFPEQTRYTDIVGFGDGRDYILQVLAGLIAGLAVVVAYVAVPYVRFQFLEISPMAIYFMVFAVPFTEEAVFGNFITTSLLKNAGILPALLLSGALFGVFHYSVYMANTFYMFMAFAFRVLAALALVKFGSFLPGLVGHVFVNTVSVLTSF